jgi:hypothetical protein
MPMITVNFRSRELEVKLYELSKKVGMKLGPIIKEEARYVLQSAVKVTPPPARQSGKRTIGIDLNRVAIPLDYQTYEKNATPGGFYKSLAKYIRRRNVNKLRTLMQDPRLSFLNGLSVIANRDELRQKHQSRRQFGPAGGGRVRGKPDSVAFRADMRRYKRSVENRVGFMLNGWAEAGRVLGVPIKKFAERNYEGSTQKFRYNFWRNPFVEVINSNIRMTQPQRTIDAILAYRIRVTQKKIDRANKKLALNLGFTTLAAGSY